MRVCVPAMNDQVSDVRDPSEGISEDEHGVPLIKQGITKQQQRARQAQPPERSRHDYPLEPFRGVPLNKKAGKKDRVP